MLLPFLSLLEQRVTRRLGFAPWLEAAEVSERVSSLSDKLDTKTAFYLCVIVVAVVCCIVVTF